MGTLLFLSQKTVIDNSNKRGYLEMAKTTRNTKKSNSKKTKGNEDMEYIIEDSAAEVEKEIFGDEGDGEVEDSAVVSSPRLREKRRKTYERPRGSLIPKELEDYFAADDYALRWVRWSVLGEPDWRYLGTREDEGYELVLAKDVPEKYLRTLRIKNTPVAKGMITNGGDLCLMKIDADLQKSRQAFYNDRAQRDLMQVNAHIKEKGLTNRGSKSRVMFKEPTF